jgi:hypothetical protein
MPLQLLINAAQLVILGDAASRKAEASEHRDQDEPVPGLEPPADGVKDHSMQ